MAPQFDQKDPTGITGLDDVLQGGLPAGQLYLIEGSSGAGKTTLGLQFLLEGVRRNEPVLWCTLAETESQLEATASAHHWDLSGVHIVNLAHVEATEADGDYSFFSASDVELNDVVQKICDTADEQRPRRVVFDPFSDVKLLARDPLRFRRQLLRLREHFSKMGATVMLIQETNRESGSDMIGEGVVHGVITLYQHAPDYGKQRRRLRVHKMRGVAFREGYHDIAIRTGGIVVYPRLVASDHDERMHPGPKHKGALGSGVDEFDRLMGGGVDLGTSLLITGPSGVGKSTLCMQFADHLARAGGKVAIYLFDETRRAFFGRAEALGMGSLEFNRQGAIQVEQVDPAAFSPGEFAHLIRRMVEEEGVQLLVIDSLNGYLSGMPDEKHLAMHMHELLSYLSLRNVATLLTLNQQGLVGEPNTTPVDVTYLTDAAVLIRYFEREGQLRRALSVVKRRTGPHDSTIRELLIAAGGIRLGARLENFNGGPADEPPTLVRNPSAPGDGR